MRSSDSDNSETDGSSPRARRSRRAEERPWLPTLDGELYRLHGEPITQSMLAEYLGDSFGVSLRYRAMGVDEYRAERIRELGEVLGSVIAGIYAGIRTGAYDQPSDFAAVSGRPHQSWLWASRHRERHQSEGGLMAILWRNDASVQLPAAGVSSAVAR